MYKSKYLEALKVLEMNDAKECRVLDDIVAYAIDLEDETGGDFEGDSLTWLHDVSSHGLISGVVPHLIYTHDIYEFFDEFYGDIMYILEELYTEMGDVFTVDVAEGEDMKTKAVYEAYQYEASRVASYIEDFIGTFDEEEDM